MNKTIMVTGGTGYLGAWVVNQLLEKGYTVRLTVRNKTNKDKYALLQKTADASEGILEIYEADLLDKGSFDEAARGSHAIMHVASPFTLRFKDPVKDLLDPAVQGTQNVLQAASQAGTVRKVVLTSSVAAVHGDAVDLQEKGLSTFTEDHFNETSSTQHQPYSYSKVMAEKEAWKIYEAQDQWKLVVINPSFVLGPALSPQSDSESLQFMRDMLSGKFRMGAPDLKFGFVDVRDVAMAHISALEKDTVQGRHILAERVMSVNDLADMIKKLFPKQFKLPLMKSPKFMLYMVGWMFGLTAKFVKRNVGHPLALDNRKSINDLALQYRPMETTVRDMVEQMVEQKMV
ncbi:MAG: NAD-dependent epimerase/dehydratase family protein [Caldithrix sp.]|nr:NAD-dependent epimerase/dehydratase family protein [Caldithrix sp.]